MAGTAIIIFQGVVKQIPLVIGKRPEDKFKWVRPQHLSEVVLSGLELDHAIKTLGAANVSRGAVRYFGDEAKRIYFNW